MDRWFDTAMHTNSLSSCFNSRKDKEFEFRISGRSPEGSVGSGSCVQNVIDVTGTNAFFPVNSSDGSSGKPGGFAGRGCARVRSADIRVSRSSARVRSAGSHVSSSQVF